MDKSDPLDPELNRMIVQSIHNDVMAAMHAKGKIAYDMTPDELDKLFETIAFNVKEKVAPKTTSALSHTALCREVC